MCEIKQSPRGIDPLCLGPTLAKHVDPYTYSARSVLRGRLLYCIMGCNACRGEDGKAGRRSQRRMKVACLSHRSYTSRDIWERSLHEDIYRTIMTGLDGTPMPGYSDLFKGEEDSAWDLVHFILSLQGR